MILCTGCGTRNPDDARACATCGRKLQSRRFAAGQGAGQAGGGDAAGGPSGAGADDGFDRWSELPRVERRFDAKAAELLRSCAEVWAYALTLIAGAVATTWAEDWRYLGFAILLAAGLAWLRKI
jgi:hypothetical protein